MEHMWVLALIVIFLVFCFKGIKQTFQRQPVVAILCAIFLLPLYAVWVVFEMVAKSPEKQVQKVIIVEKEKE